MSSYDCERCGARVNGMLLDHECDDLARLRKLEERVAVLEGLVRSLAAAHRVDGSSSGHYTRDWVARVDAALGAELADVNERKAR